MRLCDYFFVELGLELVVDIVSGLGSGAVRALVTGSLTMTDLNTMMRRTYCVQRGGVHVLMLFQHVQDAPVKLLVCDLRYIDRFAPIVLIIIVKRVMAPAEVYSAPWGRAPFPAVVSSIRGVAY